MVLKPWKLVISELWGFETLQIWPVQLKWEGIIKRDPQHVDVEKGIVPESCFLLKRSEDKNLFWTTTLKVGERFHLNITQHTHPKKKNMNYQKPFRSDVWNPEKKKKGVTSPHASPSWRGGPRWWCGKSTHASAIKMILDMWISQKMGRSAVGCNYHLQCSSISSISNRRIIY